MGGFFMIQRGKNSGSFIIGICKVGEKGQIVIPKEARNVFNIKPGDNLIALGDIKKGIALVKADTFTEKFTEE